VIALLLSLVLARTLTQPARALTSAIRAMAQGKLDVAVPVRSRDELGQLTTAFNQMSADLARANQARRQMTADIAHDLRTPLSVIKGYCEGLRDGVLKPAPNTFQTMYQEAEHLSLLVEDLRTLSLADAGELKLARKRVSARELLERAAAAHQLRAQEHQVALQVSVQAGLPEADVDPERMAQVLNNLVGNALRYTPTGGQIMLAATRAADHVHLTVRDTGAGIAPDDLRASLIAFIVEMRRASRRAVNRGWAWRLPNPSSSCTAARSRRQARLAQGRRSRLRCRRRPSRSPKPGVGDRFHVLESRLAGFVWLGDRLKAFTPDVLLQSA